MTGTVVAGAQCTLFSEACARTWSIVGSGSFWTTSGGASKVLPQSHASLASSVASVCVCV